MFKYIHNFLLIFAIFCSFLRKKMLQMPNLWNIFMFLPKNLKISYKCCKILLYFSEEFLKVFIILRNIVIILSQNTYLSNVEKCQNIAINTKKKNLLYSVLLEPGQDQNPIYKINFFDSSNFFWVILIS